MSGRLGSAFRWLFDPQRGAADRLLSRWLFLRALGLIYFSAFFSLVFQIKGLIGPSGILAANNFLNVIGQSLGRWERIWYAPTVLWVSSGNTTLMAVCWVGLVASVLLFLNLWPRGMLAICFVCFLAFVAAAQDFSGYQSDGMLLEAGFISLFFAPPGFRPGLAHEHRASRASWFLLLWEWFRIYFESGMAKILSGDPEWRHFTAMDEYYQNCPLPSWIGWYVQHLPHWFHAGTVYATLALELGLVWMLFLPRRWRIVLFFIVTPWEIGVIVTANYTFLNYLVLSLGILLLDDEFLQKMFPARWRAQTNLQFAPRSGTIRTESDKNQVPQSAKVHHAWRVVALSVSSIMLFWIFYAATAQMVARYPLPTAPVTALEPFRIANRYGLFAVMTQARYEIEFQGSVDGQNWIAYPFRYKPQALNEPPGIYAPYQPRFDWNLWFASLGAWRDYPIVPNTEVRLLSNDKDVLALFAGNPFPSAPPRMIRAVLWQYWFTSMSEKRRTGKWWRRQFLGLYAPTVARASNGEIDVIDWPTVQPRD